MKSFKLNLCTICKTLALILVVSASSFAFSGCTKKSSTTQTPYKPTAEDIAASELFTFNEVTISGENGYTIFRYIGSNQNVTIPETYRGKPVIAISNEAFRSNKKIQSVQIGSNVKQIGKWAFSICENLNNVTFASGSKLETICSYAFGGMLISIPSGTYSRTQITEITIPNKVKTIEDFAFVYCSSLSIVEFEEGSQIETIGEQAFNDTGLVTVKIPSSVKTIGKNAFSSYYLQSVSFEAENQLQSIGNSAFQPSIGNTLTELTVYGNAENVTKTCNFLHFAIPFSWITLKVDSTVLSSITNTWGFAAIEAIES